MKHEFLRYRVVVFLIHAALGQQPTEVTDSERRRSFSPHNFLASNNRIDATAAAGTPTWSASLAFEPHAALTAHSATYDPDTNVMTVFGGADFANDDSDTNAVLLFSPSNARGTWTTLISNGSGGAPPARNQHSAVYDKGSNRMIIFGGDTVNGPANDVWV